MLRLAQRDKAGSVIEVTLDTEEAILAAFAGARRELKAIIKGHKDAYVWKRDGWRQHIEGAAAECAVAKALGLFWSGLPLNAFHDIADVSPDVEVRLRPNPDQPDLSIDEGDPDDRRYVLVHGSLPTFTLVGWCWGRDHPRDRLIFVPPSELRDMDTWEAT